MLSGTPRPVVSVVIPVLNPGPLFADQLEALSRQTFAEPWELLLADNGTTDGSLSDIGAHTRGLDVRVVDASDRPGPAHARNVAVDHARGEWLAFCDADDIVDSRWLGGLFQARTAGDLIAGVHELDMLNSEASIYARGGADYWSGLLRGPEGFMEFGSTANLLISRALFVELGGFDGRPNGGKDVDLSWRVQLAGGRLVLAPDAIVHYRLREGFRAIFGQARAYTRGEAALVRRYRRYGLRPAPFRHQAREVWWLVTRAPFLRANRKRRYLWAVRAGRLVGAAQGRLVLRRPDDSIRTGPGGFGGV